MVSPPWGEPVLKALAFTPKCGGSLSIIGSTLVLRDIGRKWQDVPLPTEVMAHITISNLMIAFWECFLSTWMVPRDAYAFMAAGNTATCDAQGFISTAMFIVLEISYAILSVLYWGVVARGWTEKKTGRRKIRFLFLGLPVVIAVALASVMAAFGLFNFDGVYHCSIGEYPLGCSVTEETCTRGKHVHVWSRGFYIGIFTCTAMILVFMTLLVVAVREQERKQSRYAFMTNGDKKNLKMTRRAFWQAARYISVFCIANLPFYLFKVFDLTNTMPPSWVALVYAAIWPSFGVMNSFAYFRPKYLSYRNMNSDKSFWQSFLFTLHITLPEIPSSRHNSEAGSAPRRLLEEINDGGDDNKQDLVSPLIQEEEYYDADEDMGSLLFREDDDNLGRGNP